MSAIIVSGAAQRYDAGAAGVNAMAAPKKEIVECEYRGPWAISRGIQIGQTCWHPVNLKEGRTHLFSKSCEEWGDDCPRQRARLKEH